MIKLVKISKEKYDDFSSSQNNTNYFNSISWNNYININNNYIPHFLAIVDNNIIKSTILLLEKKLILNFSGFYMSCFYTLDNMKDIELTNKYIVKYIKKNNGLFLKVNPNIIKNDEKNKQLLKTLKYKKTNNYIKNYIYILKNKNLNSKIINKINYSKDLDLIINTNKNIFFNSISKEQLNYYKKLDKYFNNKNTKLTYFNLIFNLNQTIISLEKKLKTINNQISIIPIDNLSNLAKNKLKTLKEEKEYIKDEINKFKNLNIKKEEITNQSVIIEYGKNAYIIEFINNKLSKNINGQYFLLNNIINYYKNNKYNINVCLPKSEFIEEFNFELNEFIGEHILIINPIVYYLLIFFIKEKKI